MFRYTLLSIHLVGIVLLQPLGSALAANANEFLDYSVNGLPGRLFVPPNVTSADEPRPFVLFLHGAGERGTNNVAQVNANINNLLDIAKQRGAFLYAPQASGDWHSSSRTSLVMNRVDQALTSYNIDSNRLYVTGLSMGGGGTWNMLNRYSDRFAAGVPIAGVRPNADFNATNLLELPTWAFHARNDNVVVEQRSREVISSILAAAGEPSLTFPSNSDVTTIFQFDNEDIGLHYTEWPTGGHGIWHRVYGDTELREWMFSQSLAIPEPSTAIMLLSAIATCGLLRVNTRRHRD
jgi:predicted peptidase